MNDETLLNLLYSKNLKKTLKLMKDYEKVLKEGTRYNEMLSMMEYDYKIFLEKQKKLEELDLTKENAIFKKNEIENTQTNITSNEDALCKLKALSLANSNLYE